jgi:hypothetical protein
MKGKAVSFRYVDDSTYGTHTILHSNILEAVNIGWASSIGLREGLEKTYDWIHDEIKARRTEKGLRPPSMAPS